jgi:hypothetical protein
MNLSLSIRTKGKTNKRGRIEKLQALLKRLKMKKMKLLRKKSQQQVRLLKPKSYRNCHKNIFCLAKYFLFTNKN